MTSRRIYAARGARARGPGTTRLRRVGAGLLVLALSFAGARAHAGSDDVAALATVQQIMRTTIRRPRSVTPSVSSPTRSRSASAGTAVGTRGRRSSSRSAWSCRSSGKGTRRAHSSPRPSSSRRPRTCRPRARRRTFAPSSRTPKRRSAWAQPAPTQTQTAAPPATASATPHADRAAPPPPPPPPPPPVDTSNVAAQPAPTHAGTSRVGTAPRRSSSRAPASRRISRASSTSASRRTRSRSSSRSSRARVSTSRRASAAAASSIDALRDTQKALEVGIKKRDAAVMRASRERVKELLERIPHVTFVPPAGVTDLTVTFDDRAVPPTALTKKFSIDPGKHKVHAEGTQRHPAHVRRDVRREGGRAPHRHDHAEVAGLRVPHARSAQVHARGEEPGGGRSLPAAEPEEPRRQSGLRLQRLHRHELGQRRHAVDQRVGSRRRRPDGTSAARSSSTSSPRPRPTSSRGLARVPRAPLRGRRHRRVQAGTLRRAGQRPTSRSRPTTSRSAAASRSPRICTTSSSRRASRTTTRTTSSGARATPFNVFHARARHARVRGRRHVRPLADDAPHRQRAPRSSSAAISRSRIATSRCSRRTSPRASRSARRSIS